MKERTDNVGVSAFGLTEGSNVVCVPPIACGRSCKAAGGTPSPFPSNVGHLLTLDDVLALGGDWHARRARDLALRQHRAGAGGAAE